MKGWNVTKAAQITTNLPAKLPISSSGYCETSKQYNVSNISQKRFKKMYLLIFKGVKGGMKTISWSFSLNHSSLVSLGRIRPNDRLFLYHWCTKRPTPIHPQHVWKQASGCEQGHKILCKRTKLLILSKEKRHAPRGQLPCSSSLISLCSEGTKYSLTGSINVF